MKRSSLRVAAVLLCAGCLDDNQLSGSMSEVFPLTVSRVEIYENWEALQVTYLSNRGIYLDIVARVTFALKYPEDGGGYNPADGGYYRVLKPGTTMNLQGEYATGHPIVSVAHEPGGEPSRTLPPVFKGDLQIISGGSLDEYIQGDFSMVFQNVGGDIGFGRTLNGKFAGFPIDAGFGPLP